MPDISAKERDEKSPVWDTSQERAFMETVFNQRFNFFLVFFSLVVAGAVNARSRAHLLIVLVAGSVIALFLAYSLLRAHLKLGSILEELYLDATHPATIINKKHSKWLTVRWITGWLLPFGCTVALMSAALCAGLGVLAPGSSPYDSQLQESRSKAEALAHELVELRLQIAQTREQVGLLRVSIEARPNNQMQRTRPVVTPTPRR